MKKLFKLKIPAFQGHIGQILQLFETSSQSRESQISPIGNIPMAIYKNIVIKIYWEFTMKRGARFSNLDSKRKGPLKEGKNHIDIEYLKWLK